MANDMANANKLDQLPEAARDRIQQLRVLFVERSMVHLEQIRQLLEERQHAENPRAMDPDLVKLAHSMVGASGIFGFQDLGNAAFQLENTLRDPGYSDAAFNEAADGVIAQLVLLG